MNTNEAAINQESFPNQAAPVATPVPMVEARALVKRYPKLTAVDEVSFSAVRGEIFGLLGHNGAGKTTLIKMLTGQLAPTGGQALLGGHLVGNNVASLSHLFGIVFEEQNLYERLTATENLRLSARLYRIANPNARISEVLALVGLTERANTRAGTFSTGMKQRLLIARAILHQPAILFLDEPSRGLDPASAQQVRILIRQLSEQGTTVLITTHDMEEADQLCHRVAFVSKGRLVALDTPRNLKLRYGERTITALVGSSNDELASHIFHLDQPEDSRRFAALLSAGLVITAHSGEATLQQVFIALTGYSHD